MWTVSYLVSGRPMRSETFESHAAARRAYESASRHPVYLQVHIKGPGYGKGATLEDLRKAIDAHP